MLTYYIDNLISVFDTSLLDTNIINTIAFENYDVINNTNLMLQFGLLVFILSLIALAVPNYFGLYGSFILTIVPLFLA